MECRQIAIMHASTTEKLRWNLEQIQTAQSSQSCCIAMGRFMCQETLMGMISRLFVASLGYYRVFLFFAEDRAARGCR